MYTEIQPQCQRSKNPELPFRIWELPFRNDRWIILGLLMLMAILVGVVISLPATIRAQASGPTAPPDPAEVYRSFKTASDHRIAPSESFTYTIHLLNSNSVTMTWSVADILPAELNYVDGSATKGGTYDAGTRTLIWKDIPVPVGSGRCVSFRVVPAIQVVEPKVVINQASVVVDGYSMTPTTRIVLVPESSAGDTEDPVVQQVTIGDVDITTSQTTTLHISATDNVSVKYMYIREWALPENPVDHYAWKVTKSSGWVDYQADYSWELTKSNGVHFIGVWVADSAFNVSHLDHNAVDFASLVLPDAHFNTPALVPYLVNYQAGTKIEVNLQASGGTTVSEGHAALYVWFPGNYGLPDLYPPYPGMPVSFEAQKDGVYIILVQVAAGTTYNLSITPAGGPNWTMSAQSTTLSSPTVDVVSANLTFPQLPFNQSGIDPVAGAEDVNFVRIFMPISVR